MPLPSSPAAEPAHSCAVVLFHSVLGLRPGVVEWAERLRRAGHVVHTPDLYEGEVFDDMESAFRKVESLGGIPALIERTQVAAAALPQDVVYAGFSNGGGSAQLLALTRPGARGAVLMHAALPLDAFDMDTWPADVPVQLHYAEHDPFRDSSAIDSLAGAVRAAGAAFEAWDYPGAGHLFADPGLADFDASSAEAMFQRVQAFLERVAQASRRDVVLSP
jgi:dienelactone hydrolase